MLDGIASFFIGIATAFVNFAYAITHPSSWLAWLGETGTLTSAEAKDSLGRFIFYGASSDFFYVVFTTFLVLTAIGLWKSGFMWGMVRGLEGFANALGRTVAWVGLIMVLQQIVIIFLQRIFRVSSIEFGPFAPFGYQLWGDTTFFIRDLSWWSEELKLYNAMIVCLCISYTFVQGGHVRVDLLYANVSFRARRVIDMLGSLIFMMPAAVLTWLFAWFFMWRSLVTPKISASDKLEGLMLKSRLIRWNVETIAFSPNGFDAYFLFKVLMVAFSGLVFIQAWATLWRSWLEFREGPESAGKFLDRDVPGNSTHELQTQ